MELVPDVLARVVVMSGESPCWPVARLDGLQHLAQPSFVGHTEGGVDPDGVAKALQARPLVGAASEALHAGCVKDKVGRDGDVEHDDVPARARQLLFRVVIVGEKEAGELGQCFRDSVLEIAVVAHVGGKDSTGRCGARGSERAEKRCGVDVIGAGDGVLFSKLKIAFHREDGEFGLFHDGGSVPRDQDDAIKRVVGVVPAASDESNTVVMNLIRTRE